MAESNAMETKALKIRAVKRLFEYLEQTHQLLVNPTEGIVETCRKNRKIGSVLTMDEVKRLLSQPNLSFKTHIRDRAMMEVLYSTAIRLDELLHLEIYHADLKDKVLYIRKGKGNKQRVVPLGKHAIQYLREYLEKVRPFYARKNPKERRMFLLNSGLVMTPGSVRGVLLKYRRQANIRKSASPHTLRRSCATHIESLSDRIFVFYIASGRAVKMPSDKDSICSPHKACQTLYHRPSARLSLAAASPSPSAPRGSQ